MFIRHRRRIAWILSLVGVWVVHDMLSTCSCDTRSVHVDKKAPRKVLENKINDTTTKAKPTEGVESISNHNESTELPHLYLEHLKTLTNAYDEVEKEKYADFPYQFLIDQPSSFCDMDLEVLNIIPLRPNNVKKRNNVRIMWGDPVVVNETKTKPIFIIGLAETSNEQKSLEEENALHHDILQLNIIDSYQNLTLKTWGSLYWKHKQCKHVRWLLKSDSDVFFQPWGIRNILRKTYTDFACLMMTNRSVCRKGTCTDKRWHIPRYVYSEEFYPPYCKGLAYAVAEKAILPLLNEASKDYINTTSLFPMEDAYFTGILAKKAKLVFKQLEKLYLLDHLKTQHGVKFRLRRCKKLFVVTSFKKGTLSYTHLDLWRSIMKQSRGRRQRNITGDTTSDFINVLDKHVS
ncbi:unnamed protein product, partial [Meganyctiphanes norvegica]|uniref:Hexosyltransferase n=1 Tax=Meganyctiphanes norvegica TaxID=48144 RepID=A0AAV2R605_MEGNR